VLRPEVATAIIDGVMAELAGDSSIGTSRRRDELRKVDRTIANYVEAIADVGQMAPLLDKLRAAKRERERLFQAIAALDRADVRSFDPHIDGGTDSSPHRPLARLAHLSGTCPGRPRGAARSARRTHQVHARRANVSVRRGKTIDREVTRGNRRRFVTNPLFGSGTGNRHLAYSIDPNHDPVLGLGKTAKSNELVFPSFERRSPAPVSACCRSTAVVQTDQF